MRLVWVNVPYYGELQDCDELLNILRKAHNFQKKCKVSLCRGLEDSGKQPWVKKWTIVPSKVLTSILYTIKNKFFSS